MTETTGPLPYYTSYTIIPNISNSAMLCYGSGYIMNSSTQWQRSTDHIMTPFVQSQEPPHPLQHEILQQLAATLQQYFNVAAMLLQVAAIFRAVEDYWPVQLSEQMTEGPILYTYYTRPTFPNSTGYVTDPSAQLISTGYMYGSLRAKSRTTWIPCLII
ncbi:uncharacterized protein LOC112465673 [Temnothorax curvispinosus]|uniref:Uncharacterized protein LOC112465673 n=1 Tax=Temnothorax curvispinosus TaxID=300111 RepID=A0A6J1R8G6_9HYME|nr:uncharacterized protein LOC112465673 [Temnothorax curvispinosus]